MTHDINIVLDHLCAQEGQTGPAVDQTMNYLGLNEIRTRIAPVMNRQDKLI